MDANEGRSVSLVAKRKTFHLLASIFSKSKTADHQLTVRRKRQYEGQKGELTQIGKDC